MPQRSFLHYNRGMPVQYQNSPKKKSFIEEEQERSQRTSSKQKRFGFRTKEKKPFQMTTGKGILIGAICLLCLAGGASLRNTTLFLEQRSVDQYLPIEEYVLKDQDTGEYTQNIRSPFLKNEYSYGSHSSYKMTSRGIKVGDTWDDFVKAYGDVHADTIYVHRVGEDGYTSYEDEDSLYISDPMCIPMESRSSIRKLSWIASMMNTTIIHCGILSAPIRITRPSTWISRSARHPIAAARKADWNIYQVTLDDTGKPTHLPFSF